MLLAMCDPRQMTTQTISPPEILLAFGTRSYRARGVENNNASSLKASVKAWLANDLGKMHADTLDFSYARARHAFVAEVARELGQKEAVIKGDIARLFDQLEQARDVALTAHLEPVVKPLPKMSDEEHAEAMAYLRHPDLLKNIVKDFEKCGIIGESENLLIAYLAATSRLMPKPLAVVVQSSSSAGKTSVVDAVLAMMPPEQVARFSAMTSQSLYYMESLKGKVLSIAEEEGASDAAYALKLLQSEGGLSIATPSKDDKGRIKTERYDLEGGCSIFLTTTSTDIDEELLNRCLVLTVDEGVEQTKRIQEQQRKAYGIDGLARNTEKTRLIRLHQNCQRLLSSIAVVIPHAEFLTFHASQTRARRDNQKYLSLIQCVTLLHQFQRVKLGHTGANGDMPYIETTIADILAANKLAALALAHSMDDLPPQARKLLGAITEALRGKAKDAGAKVEAMTFTRKEARDWTGWTHAQTRRHLERLVDLEYVGVQRNHGGIVKSCQYVLHCPLDSSAKSSCGLLSDEALNALPRDEISIPMYPRHTPDVSPMGVCRETPVKQAKNKKNKPVMPQNENLQEGVATVEPVAPAPKI